MFSCAAGDGSEGLQATLPRGNSEADDASAERHRGVSPYGKKCYDEALPAVRQG